MVFRKDCEELFGTNDIYEIFNLKKKKTATNAEIKKAYYKQSILWHPDRFSGSTNEALKETATRKFQVVSKAYEILSDPDKRELYDSTGQTDEDDESGVDWSSVWSHMFKKITAEDIEKYLQQFRGSEKEMEDVKNAYVKHEGNMNHVMETVIGADVDNEDRIREIIQHYIDKGEVEAYRKFVNEPPKERMKRRAKAKKEAAEAEEAMKELQKKNGLPESNGTSDLASMLMLAKKKRDIKFNDMISNLEHKYGGKNGNPRGKKRDEKNMIMPQHEESPEKPAAKRSRKAKAKK